MTKPFYLLFIGLLLTTAAINLQANNIQVSNTKLTGQNTTDGYTLVQFDLSWENSWRTNDLNGDGVTNWDAAWVFIKYRVGTGDWQHAWLNNSGHSSGTGTDATISAGLRTPGTAFHGTTNPGIGVFIYRDADGAGTFSITGAQLRWNYGANGVADDATVDIKVFAIEMVYVPQGEFYVGSGGTESGSFTDGSWTSGATIPLSISSENALTIGQSAGNLWGTSSSGNNTIGDAGTLAAAFPKGYAAYYMMKYSITQQQYVDFLNTLTRTQQLARFASTTVGNFMHNSSTRTTPASRNGVRLMSNPGAPAPRIFGCDLNNNNIAGEVGDGQWIACNYLSWMDGAAYMDWAGLRPMTELEFEKACRGTVAPVANEYAWGTASVANNPYTLNNSGQADEGIASNYSTTAGNATTNSTDVNLDGPLRVGIFAGNSSNTGRITAGAGYYGIMELSGNVQDRPVSVGNATGRAFTGVHGDGILSANGHANEIDWPGMISGEVTGATGSGYRGHQNIGSSGLMVSDRNRASNTGDARGSSGGFRGVRVP
jgi:formylglycine-generating enzyme required for sulfatase activity